MTERDHDSANSTPQHDSGERCEKCGYNLTGLTESRCPECGTRIPVTISPSFDGPIITQCTNCGFSFSGGRCPQCGWGYPVALRNSRTTSRERAKGQILLALASFFCIICVSCSVILVPGARNPKPSPYIMLPDNYTVSVFGLACLTGPASVLGLILAAAGLDSPYRKLALLLIAIIVLNWIGVGVYFAR